MGRFEGSVSSGTLLPYHLVHVFAVVLRDLAPAAHVQLFHGSFCPYPGDTWGDSNHSFWRSEAASELVAQLIDALDENAPEGYRFGSHEGDGACFGFWPIEADG